MSNEIEQIAIRIINRNFELGDQNPEGLPLKKIREMLIERIDFLLDHDFGKLISILYRVDVDETRAKSALSSSDKKPSEVLTDLIIARQMEKAVTRGSHTPPEGDLW